MAFGFGELRMSPDAFWAMTPRELAAAAGRGRHQAAAPPTRAELADLMQCYPDEEINHG